MRSIHCRTIVILVAGGLALAGLWGLDAEATPVGDATADQGTNTASPADGTGPVVTSTADHSKFKVLQRRFRNGPDVTDTCLSCHTEAAKQVQASIHWTWEFPAGADGQMLGKRHVINSFCGQVATNEPRCTSCHAGYDWTDMAKHASEQATVDCLVCHDTTGRYKKFPTAAGHPAYEPKTFMGKTFQPPDLTRIAQQVGRTNRRSCGSCHFYGGSGDGVKHGDLDSSLIKPPRSLDVHMSPDGANLTCADCHNPRSHDLPGSRYVMTVSGSDNPDTPFPGYQPRASCRSCHGANPHTRNELRRADQKDRNQKDRPQKDRHGQSRGEDSMATATDDSASDAGAPETAPSLATTLAIRLGTTLGRKLDEHTNVIACQTCHIPSFARGGVPTAVWWDWSTAGRKKEDGELLIEKDPAGWVRYHTLLGDFRREADVTPSYAFFDGTIRYTLVGDKIDDREIVPINRIVGAYGDGHSRIWPFKVMRGRQPYDTENKTLLINHMFPKSKEDTGAFWEMFNWVLSLETAAEETGQDFSGNHDFIETSMHWPITHMVAPAEDALRCDACHTTGGRLEGLTEFFLPGRDSNEALDRFGLLLVGFMTVGVAVHSILRILQRSLRLRRKGKK